MSNDNQTSVADEQQAQTTAPEQAKTFTQDEVNQIIQQRLERDRAKRPDSDDVKAQLTALQEELAKTQAEAKAIKIAKDFGELDEATTSALSALSDDQLNAVKFLLDNQQPKTTPAPIGAVAGEQKAYFELNDRNRRREALAELMKG